MLATKEAKQLLQKANFKQLDEIYTNNIPDNAVDSSNTVALITDVATRPGDYGNNHIISVDRQIEIQIFYKKILDYDPEPFEMLLLQLFDNNGWQINEIRGHTVDPDTKQLTATFYFTDFKTL